MMRKPFTTYPCTALLFFFLLLCSGPLAHAQIGKVESEDRMIVGSSAESRLVMPYLEYLEVIGKPGYYRLWYRDEVYARDKIKSLDFQASDMELSYLYRVFKEGFSTRRQRLTVGEGRIITMRPGRRGGPMMVTVYYEDESKGAFFLEETELESLLGKYQETVPE